MLSKVPDVHGDVVIKKEKIEFIKQSDVENPSEHDVDPVNMSVYKDVISNTMKCTSLNHAKNALRFSFQIYSITEEMNSRMSMQ